MHKTISSDLGMTRLTMEDVTSATYDPGEGMWYCRFANYPQLCRMTTFEYSLLRTGLDW